MAGVAPAPVLITELKKISMGFQKLDIHQQVDQTAKGG